LLAIGNTSISTHHKDDTMTDTTPTHDDSCPPQDSACQVFHIHGPITIEQLHMHCNDCSSSAAGDTTHTPASQPCCCECKCQCSGGEQGQPEPPEQVEDTTGMGPVAALDGGRVYLHYITENQYDQALVTGGLSPEEGPYSGIIYRFSRDYAQVQQRAFPGLSSLEAPVVLADNSTVVFGTRIEAGKQQSVALRLDNELNILNSVVFPMLTGRSEITLHQGRFYAITSNHNHDPYLVELSTELEIINAVSLDSGLGSAGSMQLHSINDQLILNSQSFQVGSSIWQFNAELELQSVQRIEGVILGQAFSDGQRIFWHKKVGNSSLQLARYTPANNELIARQYTADNYTPNTMRGHVTDRFYLAGELQSEGGQYMRAAFIFNKELVLEKIYQPYFEPAENNYLLDIHPLRNGDLIASSYSDHQLPLALLETSQANAHHYEAGVNEGDISILSDEPLDYSLEPFETTVTPVDISQLKAEAITVAVADL